jgi:hypothetical protein
LEARPSRRRLRLRPRRRQFKQNSAQLRVSCVLSGPSASGSESTRVSPMICVVFFWFSYKQLVVVLSVTVSLAPPRVESRVPESAIARPSIDRSFFFFFRWCSIAAMCLCCSCVLRSLWVRVLGPGSSRSGQVRSGQVGSGQVRSGPATCKHALQARTHSQLVHGPSIILRTARGRR